MTMYSKNLYYIEQDNALLGLGFELNNNKNIC